METRHEACSAEGQPRNILERDPNRFAARCLAPSRGSHRVIHSCYALWCVFSRAKRSASQNLRAEANDRAGRHRLGRVNDAPTWAAHSAPIRNKKRRCGSIIFINSKPRRGLPGRGESPLSGAVAPYVPTMGVVTGGELDHG